MPSDLNELRDQCFADADNHGLWDDDYVFIQTRPTEIMKRYAGAELIEAEAREMKQAVDYPSHYVEELADVIIMALSVAGYLKINIDAAVRQKMDAKKPEWISVKDRLPDRTEPVNVTWVNHCPAPYYDKIKDVAQTATAVYFFGKWYWYSVACVDMLEEYGQDDPDLIDENIEITHWMPLPEPSSLGRDRAGKAGA